MHIGKRLSDILNTLNDLVAGKVDRAVSDDDFIAGVDAFNLLCNLYDELRLDRSEIRRRMDGLYPEFSRRIRGRKDIQLSMPLIKALDRYIYGRRVDNADRGPINRRNALVDYCFKAMEAYRKEPMMHSADYLYALLTASRIADRNINEANQEYRNMLNAYVADMDDVTVEEQLRRLWAYDKSRGHVAVDWEKWMEVRESLKYIDVSEFDDATFLLWCSVAEQRPLKELERRSTNSRRMQVEYLRSLACSEIDRNHRAEEKRKLNKALKCLNDDLIGDIIGVKIDADMSVSTLYALETIFFLRLQLAQLSGESNEPVYESLCRYRYEEISKALTKKYRSAVTTNEKIEILERLEAIEVFINNEHSRLALDKSEELAGTPGLTHSQQLRLSRMFDMESDDWQGTIDRLLPQACDAFDLATLADIGMFGTEEQRQSIMSLYTSLFDAALQAGDTSELGRLLSLAAYRTIASQRREQLTALAAKAASIGSLSLPEKRVIPIAAEIYSRIDILLGKTEASYSEDVALGQEHEKENFVYYGIG